MTTELATVNNHLVVRDSSKTWRWFDAWGPNVTKWFFNAADSPVVSTTTAAGYDVDTYTGGTMVAADSTDGGAIAFTPAATEDQGLQILATESFSFASKWPFYYGVKFAQVDADQADMLMGLSINDEEVVGGVTDGLYFRTADASAALSLVLEKDSAETATAVATVVDATAMTAEMYYDGSNLYCYIDGTLAATIADTNANWPDDEHLAPLLAVATGENTANIMSIYWARAIQIRQAV